MQNPHNQNDLSTFIKVQKSHRPWFTQIFFEGHQKMKSQYCIHTYVIEGRNGSKNKVGYSSVPDKSPRHLNLS